MPLDTQPSNEVETSEVILEANLWPILLLRSFLKAIFPLAN